jgi:hypothetical protein
LSVNENLCRWRYLVPDACSEWQRFLAFRGTLPARREAIPGFPSHLVSPWETLGTTTSRQTLRELWEAQHLVKPFETLGNRNVSSDPARLWEPLHLVRPCETLGTTTSHQALRDSGNHYISSGPSRLWEPQRLVRPCETLGARRSGLTLRNSGNRAPYRPKRGLSGDAFEHRKRLRPLGPEPFRARSC